MIKGISKLLQKNWFVIILFAVVSFAAYSNSFKVPFQFDDEAQIVYNIKNQNLSTFSTLTCWLNPNYRPLATFSLALNYSLGGENVRGYHVFNYLIHLLSAFFLFLFLKLIVPKNTPHLKFFPLVASLFFLLHPAQTQSVTYVVQRMTSMSGMFTLMAVYAYASSRFAFLIYNKKIKSAFLIFLTVIASVLALLSKQTAAIIPILIVLVELFFVRDKNGQRCKNWTLIISTGTLLLYVFAISIFGLPSETKEISRLTYLATQMTVIPRYFQIMLVPVGLYIDHGILPVTNFFDIFVIGGVFLIAGLLVLAYVKRRTLPLFSFGIFWIFVSLLVESSVIPIRDMMFDHRVYLPLVGFSIALWSFVFHLFAKKQSLVFAMATCAILLFGTATYLRNNTWRDRTGIWDDVTERYPGHFRGWLSVGRSLAAAGSTNYQKIIDSYEKALQIDPGYDPLWNDLATNYMKAGQPDKAIRCFKKLENSNDIEFKTMSARAQGIYFLSINNYTLAHEYLLKTLYLAPADSTALHGMSTLNIKRERWDKALDYSQQFLQNSPNNTQLLFNAGYAAFYMRNFTLAEDYFDQLISLEPENIKGIVLQANNLNNLGKHQKSIMLFEKAFQLSNDQQYKEAIEIIKRSIKQ